MSLVTTCPACGTMFKVQPDQLAAGSGEGRCSVCQHVFNAFEHRSEVSDSAARQSEPPPFESETETADVSATVTVADAPEPPEPVFTAPPLLPENLFQRRRFVWPEALKTLTAAMVLLAVAVVQSAFHFRAQVVDKFPRSYPAFAAACQLLDCSVPLPHRAVLVNIEDHRLMSDAEHDNVLILESTLNNRAEYPQVFPLIELTLMDANNQALATRTFAPQEYMPKDADIAAGLAAHGVATIRLVLSVAGINSSNYQLVTKDAAPPPQLADSTTKADAE